MIKLTDHRPWYKQAVMGLIYTIMLIVCVPFILLAAAMVYSVWPEIVWLDVVGTIVTSIVVIVILIITAGVAEWATE